MKSGAIHFRRRRCNADEPLNVVLVDPPPTAIGEAAGLDLALCDQVTDVLRAHTEHRRNLIDRQQLHALPRGIIPVLSLRITPKHELNSAQYEHARRP